MAAKRKPEEPPAGAPAWMCTMSDLMNLLLCFFVMLFAMSSVDQAKYEEFVAAMSSSFSIFSSGATAIGDGVLISNGVSQLNELDEYINSTGKMAESDINAEEFDEYENKMEEIKEAIEAANLQKNEQLAEKIEEAVDESNMSEQIDVTFTAQYVQLSMKGALLFDSGKAELREESTRILDKVGVILERYSDGLIEIEGHTDNVPINSSRFASNEELSDARALSVFYYLQDSTSLDPVSMKHSGMGERVPIADNSTEEGRSKNRRVEIRIHNPS